ncbi:hypothetical protein [Bradyrhizobium japonicum]|uniref:hypothetical protein n=1 Tax=Bradyrhizobium japonicum TaxID=375 RepID=UPI0027148021|nr:hypothetical protein [Bradyrhizobium japonicum]WLB50775.1 hypothetical protein QIH94_25760 [Bradyrhizobium japonicum]WLB67452.1 hypothetical protein QIH96_20565 [Bradyrhizobium japonicum]
MANLGEYGSLLQLGFGIGIGLSLFRAPMDLLSARLKADLDSQVDILANIKTPKANEKKSQLSDLNLEFVNTSSTLDQFHLPFMIACVFTALVNWILLALASTTASRPLSGVDEWLLFAASGPVYLFIYAVLAGTAWWKLRPIRAKLDAIRSW